MTVIYVDTLFLLNALVDYLLLLCAARLAGEPLKRLRFALGAVLGAATRWPSSCRDWDFGAARLPVRRGGADGAGRLLGQPAAGAAGADFFAVLRLCRRGAGISMLGGQGLSLNRGVIYSGMD